MGSSQTLQGADAIDWTAVNARHLQFDAPSIVFAQGDAAATVMYIVRGLVRLSVLSYTGKEAVVAILGAGEFFGESCLAGQPRRVVTATTTGPSALLVIAQDELIAQLHRSCAFADHFMAHLLKRNLRVQRDLADQLFNNSEKRLARTLLLLARYGEQGPGKIPKLSQEILAEMIGTTRTRVNLFMNRFRDLGYIEYKPGGDLTVHQSLLSVVLEH
jgi:CRP-like cAMP-binding protein